MVINSIKHHIIQFSAVLMTFLFYSSLPVLLSVCQNVHCATFNLCDSAGSCPIAAVPQASTPCTGK